MARKKNIIQAGSVDEYIGRQPEPFQESLREIRAIIQSEIPAAEERISYQIPCFKYLYMLVGFGVTKNACSLYTMNPDLVAKMKDELKGVKYSGATIHFPPGEPLPEMLIRKIVRTRVKENEEKAKSSGKK